MCHKWKARLNCLKKSNIWNFPQLSSPDKLRACESRYADSTIAVTLLLLKTWLYDQEASWEESKKARLGEKGTLITNTLVATALILYNGSVT